MSVMDGNAALSIVILVLLILCYAFFSAAETAYDSLNRNRIRNKANSGDKRAEKVLALAESEDRLTTVLAIGRIAAGVAAASLATALFARFTGGSGLAVSIAAMIAVTLLLGAAVPKGFALARSEGVAFASYPVLSAFVKLLTPLTMLMSGWKKLMNRLAKEDEERGAAEDAIMTMVEEAESDGEIDEHESELIRSAIEFTDLCVEDILTPRVDIVAVEADEPPEAIAARFAESGFSRLPVYEDSMDDIIGILHEKDFYHNRANMTVREMMTTPLCVMPTARLSVLLKQIQQSKGHMAVVMDEYGGVSGIVTLEDILERLVGEIWDEHDEIVEDFQKLPNGSYRVECSANLDDLLELFKLEKEYDSVTVSGWVLEEMGAFPQQGDTFDCEHLHVTVEKVDKRRVTRILIAPNPA